MSATTGGLGAVEGLVDEDHRLMSRVAANDRRAQQAAIDRLFPRVRCTCRRLLGRGADADDATQQALLEILLAAGSFRGLSRLETWADRITTRTALRVSKERSRWDSKVRAIAQTVPLEVRARDRSVTDAAPRHPAEYLRDLPERQRTVLILRHVLEYSIEEIADQTGVTVNTVKDRLLRARRAVRKRIRRDQALGIHRRQTP